LIAAARAAGIKPAARHSKRGDPLARSPVAPTIRREKGATVSELWQAIEQVFVVLGRQLGDLQPYALGTVLVIGWFALWLWAVNWKKVWPVLAQGAWAPVVLAMLTAALVWAELHSAQRPEPSQSACTCLGFPVANFWWQLGAVGLLVALTLFCGWLQGVFGWAPAEVELEPAAGEEHGHGHEHHGH
jgi:hypothetical protein